MSHENLNDCLTAAKVAIREFNARWNINAIQLKPVPIRYLFTAEELAPLEAAPAWYTAAQAFAAMRQGEPKTGELMRAGKQLATLYASGKRSPGPRTFYWIAPHGAPPTASDRNRLASAKLTHVVPDR